MSELDDMPDPIDQAYVKAEALLRDEAARAARRAKVLAAVATEPAAPETPVSRRSVWRRGGWLAAACVAGLSLIVVSQIYRPPPKLPPVSPAAAPPPAGKAAPAAAPAVPAPGESRASAPPAGARPAASETAEPPAPPPQLEERQREAASLAEKRISRGVLNDQTAPAPPAAQPAPAARAFRGEPALAAAPPPPPPPPSPVVAAPRPAAPLPPASDASSAAGAAADNVGELVVTGQRDMRRGRNGGFAAPADEPLVKSEGAAASRAELGVRLRAAAAAGRTAELDALLRQGAPVDAPDAAGDTALMLSLRADHAAAAAALRRRGASLERRNHAGESARDIAAARSDPALDRALGTAP
ncbi:MAG TPA: hypothetical protein VFE13_03125 [Caulobacteraceae bacterium]|nr:hypothetical protein [Caulobacteraceae bacterium]